MLVAHRGTFAIANDNGVLAKVAPNGDLVSLWAARKSGSEFQQRNFGGTVREATRSARLFSDGNYIILSDRYGSGLTIVTSDPDNGDLQARRYTGNASGDELVALRNGKALLVGRRISLLDLTSDTILWSTPSESSSGQPWGTIGSDRALVIRNNTVSLLNLDNGETMSQIYFCKDNSIAVVNDILVTEQKGTFIGYGDGERFAQRLARATQRNPDDFRPHIALYGLARATNKYDEAISHMLRALERNAPTRYAEEAASMLPRISPRLETTAALEDIALFKQLGAYAPKLITESAYWQARHFEAVQQREAAIEAYQRLLQQPTSLINLNSQINADLHALAQAGLARLGASNLPAWLAPPAIEATAGVTETEATSSGAAWELPGQPLTTPIVSAQTLFAYRNGDIHAHSINNGSMIWRRKYKKMIRPCWACVSAQMPPKSWLMLSQALQHKPLGYRMETRL